MTSTVYYNIYNSLTNIELSLNSYNEIYIKNIVRDCSSCKINLDTLLNNTTDFLYNTNNFLEQNNINQEITQYYIDTLESNLNEYNGKVKQDTINKTRMARLNIYYIKKNKFINNILQYTILYFTLLLIIAILTKKSIISNNISFILGTIILFIYGGKLFSDYVDLNKRNNYDFDKIDFTRIDSSSNVYNYSSQDGCYAADCCVSGETIYDYLLGECIIDCNSMYPGSNYKYDYTSGECIPNTTETFSNIDENNLLQEKFNYSLYPEYPDNIKKNITLSSLTEKSFNRTYDISYNIL